MGVQRRFISSCSNTQPLERLKTEDGGIHQNRAGNRMPAVVLLRQVIDFARIGASFACFDSYFHGSCRVSSSALACVRVCGIVAVALLPRRLHID